MRLTRHALLVTDRQLVPAWSGNRMRIHSLMRVLRELGWKVVLIGSNLGPAGELEPLVHEVIPVKARAFAGGPLRDFDVRPFCAAVARVADRYRPALAIAQYAWLAPTLSATPDGCEGWVDCHDILHERTERFARAGLDPWTVCSRDEELALLAHASLAITCQHRDAKVLQQLLPSTKVVCLMTPVDAPTGFTPRHATGHTVLAVGARHAGNEGIADFIRDAWPRVLERHPDSRFQIVGGIGDTMASAPGVDMTGAVDDLHARYRDAAVVVCPVTVGTGVKTKMLEALRLGKATVVTTEAEEGVQIPDRPAWLTADSIGACGNLVADLLDDPRQRQELERRAFEYGRQHVALEVFRDNLAAHLPAVAETPSVSIIVAYRGAAGQLRRCLAALLAQRYAGKIAEIVVVDGTPHEVPPRVSIDFPSIVISRAPSASAVDARAHGVSLATGDVVAVLDADCEPAADWLDTAVELLEREPHLAVVVASHARATVGASGPSAIQWYHTALRRSESPANDDPASADALVLRRQDWKHAGAATSGAISPLVVRSSPVRVVRRPAASWQTLRVAVQRHAFQNAGAPSSGQPRPVWDNVPRPEARLAQNVTVALRAPNLPGRVRPALALVALVAWYWHARALSDAHRTPRRASLPDEANGRIVTGAHGELHLRSISVIVPTAEWGEPVVGCIASLRAQTTALPVQIVVVLNGPALEQPAGDWPGVTFVHERKRGPAAARNAGVRASTGDVLAFIDADCLADPGWLAAAVSAMRGGHAGSVIAGAITRSGAERTGVALFDSVTFLQQESYVAGCHNFVTANLVVHRTVFERVGPFDERFSEPAFEDWDWGHRARRAGLRLIYEPQAQVDHPCMRGLSDLKRKAERLARGKRLHVEKRGYLPRRPSLIGSVLSQLRRLARDKRLSTPARPRLMWIGTMFAYWQWRAWAEADGASSK